MALGWYVSFCYRPFPFHHTHHKPRADPKCKFKDVWGIANFGVLGAMLEEPIKEGEPLKFKGSAMLIGANTREEVVERLKKDVYASGKVWDMEKVQIIPFKSALRKPL